MNLQITGLGLMALFVAPLSDLRLVGTLWAIFMSAKLISQTAIALKRFKQSAVVFLVILQCSVTWGRPTIFKF